MHNKNYALKSKYPMIPKTAFLYIPDIIIIKNLAHISGCHDTILIGKCSVYFILSLLISNPYIFIREEEGKQQ